MIRGLYTSALGMTTQMQRMDVTTNNLANVNTTGFRRERVAAQSFSEHLGLKVDDPGVLRMMNRMAVGNLNPGVFIDLVHVDFAEGSMRVTGNPLDVALHGQGFFVINVEGEAEPRFTRDGMFTLTSEGVLVTNNGDRVQGLGGDIVIPNGIIIINENGQVMSNGVVIDTLMMVDFEDPQTLRQAGYNYFTMTPESVQTEFAGRVEQGMLENSNVNVVREMVEMIALARAYDVNATMIQTHDRTLEQAVNQIAARM